MTKKALFQSPNSRATTPTPRPSTNQAFQTGQKTSSTPRFQNLNGVSTSDQEFWIRLQNTASHLIGPYRGTPESYHTLKPAQKRQVMRLMQGSEDARSKMPRRTLIALHAHGSLHEDGGMSLQEVITIHVQDDLKHGSRSMLNAVNLHSSARPHITSIILKAASLVTKSGYRFDHVQLLRDLTLYGPNIKTLWEQTFNAALKSTPQH